MRLPCVLAVSLIVAACSSVGEGPGPTDGGVRSGVRHEACRFDEPMLIAGLPADARRLPITDAANGYLDRRCRQIADVRRAVSLIQLRARAVAIWRSPSAMDIGVLLDLHDLARAAGSKQLSNRAERELATLARRLFARSDRPVDLLARPTLAQALVDRLVAGGVDRQRIRVNAMNAERLHPQLGLGRNAQSDRAFLIEWHSRSAPPPGGIANGGERQAPGSTPRHTGNMPDQRHSGPAGTPQRPGSARDRTTAEDRSTTANRPTHAFGGTPVEPDQVNFPEMIGWQPDTGIFSFDAKAEAPPNHLQQACIDLDSAAPPERIRHVNQERRRADLYLPGLYETSWKDRRNGHLVGLSRVGVLRREGRPSVAPTVLVYWNYPEVGATRDLRADIRVTGAAATTVGEDGVLYRVFLDEAAWPLRCIDLVFTREAPVRVRYGRLYYDDGRVHAAPFQPLRVVLRN